MAASPATTSPTRRPTGRRPTRRRREDEEGADQCEGGAFIKYLGNEEKIGSRGGS